VRAWLTVRTLLAAGARARAHVQGARTVKSKLFLWTPDAKIVVSDVDGTITKSDVFGHLMYMVGRDWTHDGVAKLFTSIAANGYKIMYLTSRPIGQAAATKGYLQNITQV
jgi:phosphatidate phosphatase LPIN